ncbi:MAG: hypothetical protein ACTMKU_08775 [Actinomycetaceae bacterium]
MSWNTAVLVVADADPSELSRAGSDRAEGTVLGDFALSGRLGSDVEPGSVAAARVPSGTVVLGDLFTVLELGETAAQALGRTTRLAIFGGTSDTYLWQESGPGGVVRELRFVAGEMDADAGEPGPAEQGLDLHPLTEDSLMELLARATGVTFDDALLETEMGLYTPGRGAGGSAWPGAGDDTAGRGARHGDPGPGPARDEPATRRPWWKIWG